MLMRNFAGGVVFSGDKVLLLKNEKDEWVLPRGIMHDGELSSEAAVRKIREESGIATEIVFTAGQTNYEFSSTTHKKPFCNKTTWYIMKSLNEENKIKKGSSRFMDFVRVDEAMNLINSGHDKSLVSLSYKKYREFEKNKEEDKEQNIQYALN
ncbi:MAG TPA: NUDIX hydrolase [Acetivibrio sp.]|uniref:NUDIX hydrolase n=1 Tax=Acetivibrio sp. TaxID=1872092 RepID=UPI002BE3C757|nr:NUDIX hydrolase [Acetivibrio sp.]HOM02881.1 NUDIX hydrolase [Acetivibrio sp.]